METLMGNNIYEADDNFSLWSMKMQSIGITQA
jgi:hypothetical protein